MRNESHSQRGIALLTVITALFALMVIAVPFAITMRMGYERTRANTARTRAQNQVDSTMRFLEAYLVRSTERVEIANRDANRKGIDNNDPEVDTRAEIQPSLDAIAIALGKAREDLQDPYGTILGYEVEDENGKLNINSASFFALGNLLGLSVLSGELEPGARAINVEDATAFPDKGYVKIGRELVKYGAKEGNRLLDCERSLLAGHPDHGAAVKHNEGQWVVNLAAWAISTYGISRHPGEYTVFETLDVSDIARLYPELPSDVPLITQADWERVLPYITIFSKGELADGWANVQAVVEGTSLPSQEGDYDTFNFENSYFYNCGTICRITEKAETNVERDEPSYEKKEVRPRRRDYAMVFDAQPSGRFESQMELFGKVHRTFDGNQMRVQYRTRHPVNINTASREVLLAVFTHLMPRNRPQERITPEIAAKVADAILARREQNQPFQGFEDLKLFLNDLQSRGSLSLTQRTVLYRNCLNPCDNGLAFGTVPITFRTFDVYTLKTTATISDRGGLLAKHSSTRVVEVGAQLTASRGWETQRDFEEQLILSNDPRYWTSGPVNTGSFVKENVEPWPRWQKQLLRHLFPWDPYGKEKSRQDRRPYETRESTESQESLNGDIRLAPARMMLDTALSDPIEVRHFDNNDLVEGNFVQGGYPVGLRGNGRLINAAPNDDLRPFSVQFWWKPESATTGNPTLFDIGEREWRNRYACYFDSNSSELVFHVADNTEINRAAEIRYDVGEQGGLQQGVWYHIHLVATGCHPSRMAMIVDGRAVGRSNILTHLSSSLSADDGTIAVENADGFPETGAVLVGTEVIEYQARGGSAFTVRQDNTGNIVGRGARGTRAAEHPRDTTVVLFGYSRPVIEDVRTGGAALEGDLGPWSPILMDTPLGAADTFSTYTGRKQYSVQLGTSGSPAPPTTGGLVMQGAPTPSTTLTMYTMEADDGTELSGFAVSKYGFDADADAAIEDQLTAFQDEGYCLVAYIGGEEDDWTNFASGGRDNCRGVVEFMKYTKSDNTANGITLTRLSNNDGAQSAPERDRNWEMLLGYQKTGGVTTGGVVPVRIVIIPVSIRTTDTDGDRYINPVDHDHITYWVAQLLTQPGADTDVWEWFRYSELISRSGFAYFLQARVPNERLLLDTANQPDYDSDVLDRMTDEDTTTGDDPVDPGDPGTDPGGTPPGDGGGGGGGPGSPGDPPPAPPADGGGGEDVPTPPSDPGDPSDGPGGEVPPDEPPRDTTPPEDGPGGELPPDEPPRDTTPPGDGSGGETPGDEPPRDETPPGDGGGGELPPSEGGPTPPDDPDPPPTDPTDPEEPPQDPDEPVTEVDEAGFYVNNSIEGLGNVVRMRGVQSDRDSDGVVDDWWGQGTTGSDSLIPSGSLVVAAAAVYGGPEPENAPSGAVTEGTASGDTTGQRFCVWPLPGKGDKITLVTGDDTVSEGDNLSVFWAMTSTNRRLYDVSTLGGTGDVRPYSYSVFLHLVAFTRHVTNQFRSSEDLNINRADARPYTRMLAFPSGEMPDNFPNLSPARIAARFTGAAHPATIDEVHGAAKPGLRCMCTVDEVTGEESTTITVISNRGTPAGEDIPDAPGVLRIGEELVVFKEAAVSSGYLQFSDCKRGVLRTTPRAYERGTPVEVLFGIRVGILEEGVTESSHALVGTGFREFARTLGCVRLEGQAGAELRIYTVNNGSSLLCPVDDTGAAIFNGRYGSTARSHEAGTPVFWHPVRYWDLFTEFTDDPNLSFWQFSTEFTGALVKRIYWEEGRAPQRINVRAVARLNEGINWNATSQNILFLSRDGDTSGAFRDFERRRTEGQNPQRFLYAMEDPQGDNLLNIEADKVEVRLFVIYETGAYNWDSPAEAGWKDTPRLESFNIEYTQQNQVRRHVDAIR